MFAGKKSAQIREILISESAWEEMTCLFAPSLGLGVFFTLLRLPIPVPNVLPGILSIVFMYIGYQVVQFFIS